MIPIHLAEGDSGLYTLKQEKGGEFRWYLAEAPTEVTAKTVEEAIRLAYKAFEADNFMPIHCGTKFPTYDRDEHGRPALFKELVAYLSSSGSVNDESVGHAFVVKEIPLKTRDRALAYCRLS